MAPNLMPVALRKTPPFAVLGCIALAMGGIVTTAFTPAARAASPSSSNVSFRLLGMLAGETQRSVVISPLSIDAALALLAEGAKGDTRAEIDSVVAPDIKRAIKAITAAASPRDRSAAGVTINFGSCLWSPPNLKFSEAFSRTARDSFSAEPISSPAEQAPALLNAWISKKTDGLIPTILGAPPDARGLVIANGVVFKGQWSVAFDTAQTAGGVFHETAATSRTVAMMRRQGNFRFATLSDGQLIELPYGDGRYSLRIFLPATATPAENWLKGASAPLWSAMGAQLAMASINLSLPRVSVDFSANLSGVLQQLGIRQAFKTGADFTAMTASHSPFYVSDVIHQTALRIDESGTKAAAATAILLAPGAAAGPEPVRMAVDRPFVFAIHQRDSDELLFIGLVRSVAQGL